PADVRLITVAGYGHPTLMRIIEAQDAITYVSTEEGDGTVPLPSATAVRADATYYVNLGRIKADHGSLPGKRQVQDLVRELLDGQPVPENKAVSSAPPHLSSAETRQTVPVQKAPAPAGGVRRQPHRRP